MKNNFFKLMLCAAVLNFTACTDDRTPTEPINIIIDGATIAPEVGGPNQPNQVYVDLSTTTTTSIQRDTWDLGFYTGNEFRVILNGSIYMAAGKLSSTNIDAVSSASSEVQELQQKVAVGTFNPTNTMYIDGPEGDLKSTAIDEVSLTDHQNFVYLVNLGYEVGIEVPSTGSVAISGGSRGWKKIRVLSNGENYTLQYANLDANTHQEVSIHKNNAYQFTFFSFNSESVVNVEPEKVDWDLNFTVFTNEIPGAGSYGYSDFVVQNSKANVKIYKLDSNSDGVTYNDFNFTNITLDKLASDQRGIGSSWRNGGGPGRLPSLKETVFYIIEDTEGNLYKLKFLALTNAAGERGYPEFIYKLIPQ